MKNTSLVLIVILTFSLGAAAQSPGEQCTSAVILPAASTTGGPVLWKNRDTDHLSNKIVYVEESPHDYLNLALLDNFEGTGFLPALLATETEIMSATREFLGRIHTPVEYRAHQEAMAARALAAMRAAASPGN